jgi:hypothetical protein
MYVKASIHLRLSLHVHLSSEVGVASILEHMHPISTDHTVPTVYMYMEGSAFLLFSLP